MLVAMGDEPLHKGIAADALDGRLTRRIDGRHGDDVGIVEAGAKLLHQIAQPREAVRLNDGDDASLARLARGIEHSGDLDRMMAVIIDDADLVPGPGLGEAPLDTAEILERLADDGLVDAERVGD